MQVRTYGIAALVLILPVHLAGAQTGEIVCDVKYLQLRVRK